jgi:catechol 2,3-dioxygenase-like lactoylglutathione lyase family enzyme
MAVMTQIKGFDHVGITVDALDVVTAFFVGLGLEVEGRTFVEGEFLDTVCGIPDSRTEVVMLRPPGGGTGIEHRASSDRTTSPGRRRRWRTSWVCATSASRSPTYRRRSIAMQRMDTA